VLPQSMIFTCLLRAIIISQPIALKRQYMPYPEPPGTQGQKIESRSGKQGPCLEGGPVLGLILGGPVLGSLSE
jgi:hypothetical protein